MNGVGSHLLTSVGEMRLRVSTELTPRPKAVRMNILLVWKLLSRLPGKQALSTPHRGWWSWCWILLDICRNGVWRSLNGADPHQLTFQRLQILSGFQD